LNFVPFFDEALIFIYLIPKKLFCGRYEREVNYGHRSAIKKILDGDASPASMMVLCISSVYSHSAPEINKLNETTDAVEDNKKISSVDGAESNHATKIELTDGW